MEGKLGIVILSGGMGSRMGYMDKGRLLYRKKSFLFQIMDQLSGFALPFYLSSRDFGGELKIPGISQVVVDLPFGTNTGRKGPMGGIWSCFMETDLDGFLLTPCDMPLIREGMARRLIEQRSPEYDAVVWRTREGRIQPLCGFYSRTCLPALESCLKEENYSMREFLSRISCLYLDTAREHIPDQWFFNVNDQEAYELLNKRRVPVLAVSGSKNTGKTTLLEKLVTELKKRGIRTAVIKHDGHEFEADVPGTDSFRMKQAGACGTVVYSDSKFSLVKDEKGCRAEDFFPLFPDADLILLEGQKNSRYQKMETLRSQVSKKPVCSPATVLAYVTDGGWSPEPEKSWDQIPKVLSAEDTDQLLEVVIGFMDENGNIKKAEDTKDDNGTGL